MKICCQENSTPTILKTNRRLFDQQQNYCLLVKINLFILKSINNYVTFR